MAQQTNRRKKAQIDPKTLKKSSRIAKKQLSDLVVTGAKVKTTTGFRIPGHSGKVIETYYESLLPGTASDLVTHPKKDRTVRVLAGGGFVSITVDGDITDRRIQPGDEVILKAGMAHRFATTSGQKLDLHVSQESKYEARMEVLEESTATAVPTAAMLEESERIEMAAPGQVQGISPRRGSKARIQQLQSSGQRTPSGQIITNDIISPDRGGSADHASQAAAVMNARPSMGRFGDEGAG